MDFIIDGPDAIKRLATDRSLRPRIRRIVIACVAEPARGRLEAGINRAYFACGCQWGAAAVLVALCGAALAALVAPMPVGGQWWKLALIVAAASVLGKGFGLALNRIRLRRSLDLLAAEIALQASRD